MIVIIFNNNCKKILKKLKFSTAKIKYQHMEQVTKVINNLFWQFLKIQCFNNTKKITIIFNWFLFYKYIFALKIKLITLIW